MPRPLHTAMVQAKVPERTSPLKQQQPPHSSQSLRRLSQNTPDSRPPLSWDALVRTAALKRSLSKVKSPGARRVLDSLFGGPSSASNSAADLGLGTSSSQGAGSVASGPATGLTVGSEPYGLLSTVQEAHEHPRDAGGAAAAEGDAVASRLPGDEAGAGSMAHSRWLMLAAAVWSRRLYALTEVSAVTCHSFCAAKVCRASQGLMGPD